MRNNIGGIIRFIAFAMAAVSVIAFIVCLKEAKDAGSGYITRDRGAEFMWNLGAIQCVAAFISSFVVCGFSYIVEASCKYLDRCENEEYTVDTEETEE